MRVPKSVERTPACQQERSQRSCIDWGAERSSSPRMLFRDGESEGGANDLFRSAPRLQYTGIRRVVRLRTAGEDEVELAGRWPCATIGVVKKPKE